MYLPYIKRLRIRHRQSPFNIFMNNVIKIVSPLLETLLITYRCNNRKYIHQLCMISSRTVKIRRTWSASVECGTPYFLISKVITKNYVIVMTIWVSNKMNSEYLKIKPIILCPQFSHFPLPVNDFKRLTSGKWTNTH